MTNPDNDLLATTEGVDEGSAESSREGLPSTEELTGVENPLSRALGDPPSADAEVDAEPAPPVGTETGESRSARESSGTGQQLEAGEG